MTDSQPPEDDYVNNDVYDGLRLRSLAQLAWAIESSVGQFKLILARCNYAIERDRLISRLQEICQVEIRVLAVQQSNRTLYTAIQEEFGEEIPACVMVVGLESVQNLSVMLTSANQVREEFRKNFAFPLVLWIDDEIYKQLIQLAPDLESWATTRSFAISTQELVYFIIETANQWFSNNLKFSLDVYIKLENELKTAQRDLLNQPDVYNLEIQANLESLLGFVKQINNQKDSALEHYHKAYKLWQQSQNLEAEAKIPDFSSPHPQNLTPQPPSLQGNGENSKPLSCKERGLERGFPEPMKRQVKVLGEIGFCYYLKAFKHQDINHPDWQTTWHYIQEYINFISQFNSPDLIASAVVKFGDILRDLQKWEMLQSLSEQALVIHQTNNQLRELAKDYGFLAEVALAQKNWLKANQLVNQALEVFAAIPNVESANTSGSLSDIPERDFKSKDLSLYQFILGRSQYHLGQIQEASLSLETAINLGNPLEDVRLYLDILRFLQQLYFEQKKYLKAYNIKQQQRSVEQQFGLRAFIGAGRLEATKQAFVETLRSNSPQGNIAPEIAASGRLLDVERLIERMSRSDYKLIVIHGESGVGKSSLVNAGLVPALKNKAIGIQDYLPVVMRVYTNWVEELGKLLGGCEEWRVCRDAIHRVFPEWRESELGTSTSELGTSTSELGTSTSELGTSTFDIQNTHSLLVSSSSRPNADAMNRVSTKSLITQLRENEQRNLRTVLIFDQFEEFFFAYTEPAQRKQFFEFMGECLNTVQSLRVILSLRVDYIHYLLEFNDLSSLKIVGDGILCNHVLYKLGNFSPADAKSIIQRLTENTSFRLEPALVEQLVLDLAGELGEVRPIELQVVGAQLQTENITTLAEYRQGGTKDELVKRYLDEVVNDCGEENHKAAEILLYLLTDEKGTRPLKTRAELERDLYNTLSGEADKTQFSPSNVDLVLEIFVQSSLVVLLTENPADRYQLVHDYIAAFIRQQRKLKLKDLMVAELEIAWKEAETANNIKNQLVAELEIAWKEANTANQIKSQFLATISHELRTPINIIINCIRLVHDGLCDNREEEMEFLMRADQTAIHLLSNINDLLGIYNIEAGSFSVVTEPIDLRKILLEVVNIELVYKVQKKGLQLKTALGTEPILVKANAAKLKQVLINVIGNAIKFTEEGSITITAEIHHSVDKSQAIVNVTDTGIGIDPAQQHKLFRPFVMLDSVNTPKFNSMGLGLAVSRKLIELMGGSIILESAGLNQGTTVTMFLPLIDISLLPVLDR